MPNHMEWLMTIFSHRFQYRKRWELFLLHIKWRAIMNQNLNKTGFFGNFGGRFVPPALERALEELETAFYHFKDDTDFNQTLEDYLHHYVGRETPLTYAKNLSDTIGGAKIYLKREDLNHTGAHKINNCIGQILLAKKMGKTRIIAETGAGQHGVATATVCALMGLPCTIYMGSTDMNRQALNVYRMKLLGATVIGAKGTLKEAVDAALNDYIENAEETFYLLGSAVGPHPYPLMVRHFQSVIGKEAKKQHLILEGRLPNYLIACVGGGSNAIGLFHHFYEDTSVQMIGVEPAGKGLETKDHAATLTLGTEGVIHGFKCLTLQEPDGSPSEVHSIAPGLDYPGVGPEHCFYKTSGRAKYVTVTDEEALDAFQLISKTEGIIPALESSHAIAYTLKLAKTLSSSETIICNLSGRGDKDVETVKRLRP